VGGKDIINGAGRFIKIEKRSAIDLNFREFRTGVPKIIDGPIVAIDTDDPRDNAAPLQERNAPSGKVASAGADIQNRHLAQSGFQYIRKNVSEKKHVGSGKKPIDERKLP
jgi:hypothetical protein